MELTNGGDGGGAKEGEEEEEGGAREGVGEEEEGDEHPSESEEFSRSPLSPEMLAFQERAL